MYVYMCCDNPAFRLAYVNKRIVTTWLCFRVENRGGHRGPARGVGGRQQNSTLRFDGEFDFETSNAQFDKVQIEKELKEKLTIGSLLLK